MGEVRCARIGAGRVRITFAPSVQGAVPEQVDSAGPSCELGTEVYTMRAVPARLGFGALARVTHLGEATRPTEVPAWLRAAPDSRPTWPLALVVRQARATSVKADPDPRAVYHLVASPEGVVLERAGG
jgi:hypothetical protein